ncbi:ethanolamine ammonia lyase large subunit, partial [Rhizobium rhizogenes]
MYSIILGRERHVFEDLKSVMACASPLKSGDVLAGIAASSNERRVAARCLLADM